MSAPVGFNLLSKPIRFYNDVLLGGSITRSFVIRHQASVNTGGTRLLTPISVNTSWKLAYKMATYWILFGCMGSPHVHDKAPVIWIDGDEFLPALLVQSGMFFRAVIVFYDNCSDGYDQSGPFAFILSLFNHKKSILGCDSPSSNSSMFRVTVITFEESDHHEYCCHPLFARP
ncbi:hypothetical protein L1987_43887 [Smallanthus sonchifolius]|uniref:Uncharacterized protein n=1 Tax=Smallanthus sonchifolius TaxID=185202 RepID=A0ACB9GPY3_9ASTR|nr:hypothetical protein L1987_43887 [Smallanthus sonchifolius]